MDNHKFVDKSKGGIVLERLIGPGGLRAPPEVALPCIGGHCYYQLSVFFFFLSLVSPSFASDPLRGNSRVRRYIQKKIFVFGNINSFTKKS